MVKRDPSGEAASRPCDGTITRGDQHPEGCKNNSLMALHTTRQTSEPTEMTVRPPAKINKKGEYQVMR